MKKIIFASITIIALVTLTVMLVVRLQPKKVPIVALTRSHAPMHRTYTPPPPKFNLLDYIKEGTAFLTAASGLILAIREFRRKKD